MRHNRRGFTLIELIIVIVIIGILVSIAVPMIQGVKVKAICSEAATGIAVLRAAFNNYYLANQRWPSIPSYRWLTNPGDSSTIDPATLNALGLTGATLDSYNGRYFSSNCYLVGSTPSSLNIYVFTRPDLWTAGTSNTSQGGQSGETQSIVDPPQDPPQYGLIYEMDTPTVRNRLRNYNISKSGFPTS